MICDKLEKMNGKRAVYRETRKIDNSFAQAQIYIYKICDFETERGKCSVPALLLSPNLTFIIVF